MALIPYLSQEALRNKILNKWLQYNPNVNVADDSQIFMDADAIAEAVFAIEVTALSLAEEAFIGYATGDRLTNLGLERGFPRKEASKATGSVTFSRSAKANVNYPIVLGTQVSTQPDTSGNTIVFLTTEAAILYGTLVAPSNLQANANSSGGSLGPSLTNFYVVTAVDGLGQETTASNEVQATTSAGSTNSISLTWDAVANAASYNVYVSTSSGTQTLLTNTTGTFLVHTSGTGDGTTTVPVANNTGATSVSVAVEASNEGNNGNVPAGAISFLLDIPSGIDEVTNPLATAGGADEETDSEYRDRMQTAFITGGSQSKTTKSGYEQTALAISGVTTALVDIPTSGAYRNEFNLYITSSETPTGIPSTTLINLVQEAVDDDDNRSPNDVITVLAPTPVNVNVQVQLTEWDTDYDIAELEATVKENITAYLNGLTTGEDAYIVGINNAVHDTSGVLDFTLLSPVSNVTIGATQKAVAGTITVVT